MYIKLHRTATKPIRQKGKQKMTSEEFTANLGKNVELTDNEWNIIQTVYNFHPAIGTKKDIATLYNLGGMTIIKDMLPRSEAIRDAEKKLSEARLAYEKAREYVESLKK
jgi:hypothetical protein